MDKISIKNLRVYCHHGVYEAEKQLGQNFYISAELSVDTYPAGISDNICQSVNYAQLCHGIYDYMTGNNYNLIEAVAHNLAVYILNYSPLIRAVDLTVSKPEAPVGLPFENISVSISRGWHTAYIAYGSNIGDSSAYINTAIEKLKNNPAIRLIAQSATIITKPYGGVEQDDFLNGCVKVETYLSPLQLLDELHSIENDAGRVRNIHWGPRTLDLDILLYDEMIIHTDTLIIPHIDMSNRTFVLEPLCEIAPYAYNPLLKKTAAQMLEELKEK